MLNWYFNILLNYKVFNNNFLDDLWYFNNLDFVNFDNLFNNDCHNFLDWLLNNFDILDDLNLSLFNCLFNNLVLVDNGLNYLIDLDDFFNDLFNLIDDEFLHWYFNDDITLDNPLLEDWNFNNLNLLN